MVEPPVRVLYIAGVSHCGSTFLGSLLGQADGVFFAGELAHTARALERGHACGCGLPLRECPVWKEVFAAAFERTGSGSPELLRLSHADERARSVLRHELRNRGLLRRSPGLERAQHVFVATLAAIRSTTGSALIVDSSKSPAYGQLLAASPDVDLRIVHVVRDPRATAWSWQKSPDLPYGPTTVSLVWSVWNPVIELLWGRSGSRYLRLRYEDLVASPRATAGRVLAFAGEGGRELPFVSDRAVELGTTHSTSGNRNRFRTGVVEIALDDAWRHAREFRGGRRVGALTWPLRRRYGY